MAKTGNPFLDQDYSEWFDVRKLGEQFKVPGFDAAGMLETQRKNMEAITQANRVVFEGAQAVAQRQGEIMRETMEEAAKAMQAVTEAGSPEDRAAKQAEIVKEAYETALTHVRELSEMSVKSNNEALEVINKRFGESLDELRDEIRKATKQAASGGSSAASSKKH